MSVRLGVDDRERYLRRLGGLLDQARVQGRTMTYLEVADALDMPGPQRIHKTTRLLELLLKHDAERGCAPRAALVISRAAPGLPARGFFDRARRLGLLANESPEAFHRRTLQQLFAESRAP